MDLLVRGLVIEKTKYSPYPSSTPSSPPPPSPPSLSAQRARSPRSIAAKAARKPTSWWRQRLDASRAAARPSPPQRAIALWALIVASSATARRVRRARIARREDGAGLIHLRPPNADQNVIEDMVDSRHVWKMNASQQLRDSSIYGLWQRWIQLQSWKLCTPWNDTNMEHTYILLVLLVLLVLQVLLVLLWWWWWWWW